MTAFSYPISTFHIVLFPKVFFSRIFNISRWFSKTYLQVTQPSLYKQSIAKQTILSKLQFFNFCSKFHFSTAQYRLLLLFLHAEFVVLFVHLWVLNSCCFLFILYFWLILNSTILATRQFDFNWFVEVIDNLLLHEGFVLIFIIFSKFHLLLHSLL